VGVEYRCSACHNQFASDDEPHGCPKCGALAGLEVQHGTPLPMRLFGMLLASVLAVSAVGGAVALLGS
jgi:NAD-dependent SIR2 family protein deacetylase